MWQVSISTSRETEGLVVNMLERVFQASASVYTNADTGAMVVSVYPEKLPRGARQELQQVPGKITIKKLPRENWAESWKRHFHPIEIGRTLLIKPSWSRRRAKPGQRVVILDPGLSFGTGQHATTSFCLQRLAACRRPGVKQSFLDIGAGSGILAISAAKLGYSPVEAFDYDPEAVRVSRQNVRKNRVQDRVQPRQQDLTRLPSRGQKQFDVICANLIYDVLIGEAGRIVHRLKPGGQLVLAGILRGQFPEVEKVFHSFNLTLVVKKAEKEWLSGQFDFRGSCESAKPGRNRKC